MLLKKIAFTVKFWLKRLHERWKKKNHKMTESCEAAGSRSCLSYHSCPRSGKKTPPSTSVFLVSTPFPSSLPPVNQNVISSMSNHGKPFKNCDSICPQSPLAMCVCVCVWIIHVCSDLLEERISYWDWNSYFKKVLQTHTHMHYSPIASPSCWADDKWVVLSQAKDEQ